MVAPGDAVRTVVAIASLWLAGCFYVDPINQRPSLDIRQDSVGDIFRGDTVSFTAVAVDPDDHGVELTWYAYMCTDATTFSDCDAASAFAGTERTFGFEVPMTRADGVTPVAGMRIVLDGMDDHGAIAKPNDQLQLAVKDRSPDLELRRDSIYKQPGPQFVVDMPIDVYAVYGDGDDALDALSVEWKVYAPSQVPIDLVDQPIESPPGKRQVAKVLTPQITGEWSIEVTVRDPGGNATTKLEKANVVDDRPPCLDTVAPVVPPAGVATPVDDPTLFEVTTVLDDLDSYPRTPGGSRFGEAAFTWSILGPTGPRQVAGTGSNLVFDPDVYTPGSIVEVRVEIADRKARAVNCPDADPTCSVGANSCIQRQTWRVETR